MREGGGERGGKGREGREEREGEGKDKAKNKLHGRTCLLVIERQSII